MPVWDQPNALLTFIRLEQPITVLTDQNDIADLAAAGQREFLPLRRPGEVAYGLRTEIGDLEGIELSSRCPAFPEEKLRWSCVTLAERRDNWAHLI